jgi:hypothetical protein
MRIGTPDGGYLTNERWPRAPWRIRRVGENFAYWNVERYSHDNNGQPSYEVVRSFATGQRAITEFAGRKENKYVD